MSDHNEVVDRQMLAEFEAWAEKKGFETDYNPSGETCFWRETTEKAWNDWQHCWMTASRLTQAPHVPVSREEIAKAFNDANPDALCLEEYDHAIYALQLYRSTRALPTGLSQQTKDFLLKLMDSKPEQGWKEWREAYSELQSSDTNNTDDQNITAGIMEVLTTGILGALQDLSEASGSTTWPGMEGKVKSATKRLLNPDLQKALKVLSLPTPQPDKIAGQSGNAGVSDERAAFLRWFNDPPPGFEDSLEYEQEDAWKIWQARALHSVSWPILLTVFKMGYCKGTFATEESELDFQTWLEEGLALEYPDGFPTPDTSKIDAAVEALNHVSNEASQTIGTGKKARFLQDEDGEAMWVISNDALEEVRAAIRNIK